MRSNITFKDYSLMLKNGREAFFRDCTNSSSCPIKDIWFQRSNSTERDATILEYAPERYLVFERSTFESSRFDNFIHRALTTSINGCDQRKFLDIENIYTCNDNLPYKELLSIDDTELDFMRRSGAL